MSAFLRRYWASLTGARITPREETMSTPGMGAAELHGLSPEMKEKMSADVLQIFESYREIASRAMAEVALATIAFPPMRSGHEGFAILKEEVDELWDEVRAKNDGSDQDRTARMRKEAIQVAAMALRFIHDVCGDE